MRQIGQIGGRRAPERYGTERFRELGKKRATGLLRRRGTAFLSAIGQKGPEVLNEHRGPEYLQSTGPKGVDAIRAAYGCDEYHLRTAKSSGSRKKSVPHQGLLSLKEAAKTYGVLYATMYDWSTGALVRYTFPDDRRVYVSVEAVERLLAQRAKASA